MVIVAAAGYAHAAYKDDIGWTQLNSELGASTPNGAGVPVAQIEANSQDNPEYMPEASLDGSPVAGADSHFNGITFTPQSGPSGESTHAVTVGRMFYGNLLSVGTGISAVENYSADNWIYEGVLHLEQNLNPALSSHGSRLSNHSYIGFIPTEENPTARDDALTVEALQRMDWLINDQDHIAVVGSNNNGHLNPLFHNSFNVISVGLTRNGFSNTIADLHSGPYQGPRANPIVTAPLNDTSASSDTALVSGAMSMLFEVADDSANTNDGRSEVLKAVVMAGASRQRIDENPDNGTIYTVDLANGLDSRFGAGEINVYNNHHILTAGETDSDQDDGGGSGAINPEYGWDYDASFGADGNNTQGSYFFTALADMDRFIASLAWNIEIDISNLTSGSPDVDTAATLYNLDLRLFDITGAPTLVAESDSTMDNTENLMVDLIAGRLYELRVVDAHGSNFEWDYGLAWRSTTTAIPEPSTCLTLVAGLLMMGRSHRKMQS